MYSVAISLVHKDNDRKLEFALPQKFCEDADGFANDEYLRNARLDTRQWQ